MSPPRLELRLVGDERAPMLARRALNERFGEELSPAASGALRLLVSELVTNAVRHASTTGEVRLKAWSTPQGLRVEVRDPGEGFAPGTPTPRGADGGYGLVLVERMAQRWGVDRDEGTCVWFELAA